MKKKSSFLNFFFFTLLIAYGTESCTEHAPQSELLSNSSLPGKQACFEVSTAADMKGNVVLSAIEGSYRFPKPDTTVSYDASRVVHWYSSDDGKRWGSKKYFNDWTDTSVYKAQADPFLVTDNKGNFFAVHLVDKTENGIRKSMYGSPYFFYSADGGSTWNARGVIPSMDVILKLRGKDILGGVDKPVLGISPDGKFIGSIFTQINHVNDDEIPRDFLLVQLTYDNGKTWERINTILPDSNVHRNPMGFAIDNSGKKLLISWDQIHIYDLKKRLMYDERVFTISNDGGKTWKHVNFGRSYDDRGEKKRDSARGNSLPKNTNVAFSNQGRGYYTGVNENAGIEIRSSDNLEDWKNLGIVSGKDTLLRPRGNPVLVVNERYVHVAWIEENEKGMFNIFYNYSNDKGKTWGTPLRVSTGQDEIIGKDGYNNYAGDYFGMAAGKPGIIHIGYGAVNDSTGKVYHAKIKYR